MEKAKLQSFCLTLPGVTHDYQVDWQADRYHIGGKMFAMSGRGLSEKANYHFKMRPYSC